MFLLGQVNYPCSEAFMLFASRDGLSTNQKPHHTRHKQHRGDYYVMQLQAGGKSPVQKTLKLSDRCTLLIPVMPSDPQHLKSGTETH